MSAPSFAHVQWRKSSRSAQNDQCVEVAPERGIVGLRDSKDPSGPKVILRSSAFRRFVADVRDGVHDL
ncbi:DUF397 domain-containing protein [Actinomadura algeriensis]|uniref:DUF397 domain-containing protein n=1 Tax=Actinomadura algeriensis TaxID=1679523 RepID=A0ABR9JPH2_9ACTN|nr:DUF397 domain-containing protein [Actinomadura algeriensis]MBE1532461.1 hypothetical protein [Actinomadura algeriensis]